MTHSYHHMPNKCDVITLPVGKEKKCRVSKVKKYGVLRGCQTVGYFRYGRLNVWWSVVRWVTPNRRRFLNSNNKEWKQREQEGEGTSRCSSNQVPNTWNTDTDRNRYRNGHYFLRCIPSESKVITVSVTQLTVIVTDLCIPVEGQYVREESPEDHRTLDTDQIDSLWRHTVVQPSTCHQCWWIWVERLTSSSDAREKTSYHHSSLSVQWRPCSRCSWVKNLV
jgi:hypothetical protein